MAKRMLIDATHPEETRVVVLNGNRLEEFDFETSTKKQVKGNIYLAKVTRVEPSLQAAFVDYGGNRHGFLAFSEIHSDYYRIPVGDREERDGVVAADEPEARDAVPDDVGVPLAAALPEHVMVAPSPETGEDEADGIDSLVQREPVFDAPAPRPPSEDAENRPRERLIGLPWEDLAPDLGTAGRAPAATGSQPTAPSAVAVEDASGEFDQRTAAYLTWDHLGVAEEVPREIAE